MGNQFKHAKIYKNTNLEHTFGSSNMTTKQANPLKSLKIIKNHARNQEISKVSTERGQVVHGDQWEIDQGTLKLTSHPKIFVILYCR